MKFFFDITRNNHLRNLNFSALIPSSTQFEENPNNLP